ncbi:MAG TPA: ribonuclease P protein component [Polyangia bacterium]|nr:ribonuclease P protein component [Polyangia bacterium]
MVEESFPAAERLRKRSEFLLVQRRGKKLQSPHFLVFVRTGSQPSTRIGITVSKKVGGAVQRNRIKRLVREVFRRNKSLFPGGKDIVLVAKRNAIEIDYAGLVQEMRQAFCKWPA